MPSLEILFEENFVSFEGLFSLKKIREALENWAGKNNYDILVWQDYEKKPEESKVKTVQTYIKFYKEVSDYAAFQFEIEIEASNLERKRVKIKGKDYMLFKGNLSIKVIGTLVRDYEKKWRKSSVEYFFRYIADKLFFGTVVSKWEKAMKKDYEELKKEIYDVLNFRDVE